MCRFSSMACRTSCSLDSKQRNIWELRFITLRTVGGEPLKVQRIVHTGINDYKNLRWEYKNHNAFVITFKMNYKEQI